MSKTLGGNVVIRNGFELDYCWKEAVNSLLPVCDHVVICDSESTDGTLEEVKAWVANEPKLSMCVWPWPNPKGNPEWFEDFINYNREHIQDDWQFQLDGDEVLDESSYSLIRSLKANPPTDPFAAWCHRLTFWSDHRHLVPSGVMLADRVVRIAPQNIFLPSDGCHSRPNIPSGYAQKTDIRIFHYGFLRRHQALFKKERLLHESFFNSYDPRMEAAEKNGKDWAKSPSLPEWSNQLVKYSGPHPKVAHQWLKERGCDT